MNLMLLLTPPLLALVVSTMSLSFLAQEKLRGINVTGGVAIEVERTFSMLAALTRTARVVVFNTVYLDLFLWRHTAQISEPSASRVEPPVFIVALVYHLALAGLTFWLWGRSSKLNYLTFERRTRTVSLATILWVVTVVCTLLPTLIMLAVTR